MTTADTCFGAGDCSRQLRDGLERNNSRSCAEIDAHDIGYGMLDTFANRALIVMIGFGLGVAGAVAWLL